MEKKRQRAWEGVATMVTLLAWVVFIVLFALLWTPSPGLFQNIVILITSLVAAVTVGAGAYGMRYEWEPSRIGAAVEEAVKEKVKEKLEERGIESDEVD